MIKKCLCEHKYQDKKYGEKMRVANPTKTVIGTKRIYRCTVCGKDIVSDKK